MRQKILACLLSLTMSVWTLVMPVAIVVAQDAGVMTPSESAAQPDIPPTDPQSPAQITATPESTGPQEPTGPQVSTGAILPTGPQAQTGPQGPTGVQAAANRDCTDPAVVAAGYCRGRNQGLNQGANQGQSQGQAQGQQQGVHQNDPNTPVSAAAAGAPATPTTGPSGTPSLGAASAAAGELTNDRTGAGSTNTNDVDHDRTLDLTRTNTATVDNDVNLGVSTGENALNRNTSVGNLTTGDIQGSVSLVNVANSLFAPGSSAGIGDFGVNEQGDLVLLQSGERAYLPSNTQTGADSTNTNTVSGTDVIRILTRNDASVDNDIDINAETGANTLTDNSVLGDILTGSIDLAVNLINLLNLTMPDTVFELDIWSIFGDLMGDIEIAGSNAQTGADSTNSNTVSQATTIDATVTNESTIDNVFDIATETGANTLDRNTTVGDLSTGNVDVEGNVTNIANAGTPTLYLVNVLGTWTGGSLGLPAGSFIINELGNALTGAGSTNTNTVDQTTDVDVDITNTADVTNRIGIDASTGGNTVARNTTVGDIQTGDIKILANVVNFLNSAASQFGKFSLGIINIFGDWSPKPVIPPSVSTLSSTGGTSDGQSASVSSTSVHPTVLSASSSVGPGGQGGSIPTTQLAGITAASPSPASTLDSPPAHPATATTPAGMITIPSSQGPSPAASQLFVPTSVSLAPSVAVASSTPGLVARDRSDATTVAASTLTSLETAPASSSVNWQLLITLMLGGLFLLTWGTVEVLAHKQGGR